MFKAGDLRKAWKKIAPGLLVGVPAGAVVAGYGQNIPVLNKLYQWSNSENGQGSAQWLMAMTALFVVYEYFRNQRKEIENDAHQNTLTLQQNYQRYGARYDQLQQWYTTERRVIRQMKLQHKDHALLNEQITETDSSYYSQLVGIFEQGYMDFYEPDKPEYGEYWDACEGDINQRLNEPGFRQELPNLLTNDINQDFVTYMKVKIDKLAKMQPPTVSAAVRPSQTLH